MVTFFVIWLFFSNFNMIRHQQVKLILFIQLQKINGFIMFYWSPHVLPQDYHSFLLFENHILPSITQEPLRSTCGYESGSKLSELSSLYVSPTLYRPPIHRFAVIRCSPGRGVQLMLVEVLNYMRDWYFIPLTRCLRTWHLWVQPCVRGIISCCVVFEDRPRCRPSVLWNVWK